MCRRDTADAHENLPLGFDPFDLSLVVVAAIHEAKIAAAVRVAATGHGHDRHQQRQDNEQPHEIANHDNLPQKEAEHLRNCHRLFLIGEQYSNARKGGGQMKN